MLQLYRGCKCLRDPSQQFLIISVFRHFSTEHTSLAFSVYSVAGEENWCGDGPPPWLWTSHSSLPICWGMYMCTSDNIIALFAYLWNFLKYISMISGHWYTVCCYDDWCINELFSPCTILTCTPRQKWEWWELINNALSGPKSSL